MRFADFLVPSIYAVLCTTSADRQAIDAYNRGDYQTAVQIIRPLAEGGKETRPWLDAFELSGFRRMIPSSTWYRLSAEQGFAKGQSSLGLMHEHGRGVVQNLTKAVKWYRLAAEQGNEYGQKNLGVMYKFGRGVEKISKKAVMVSIVCRARFCGRAK